MAVAVILEQGISPTNGSDEEILVAVVVDIREGGSDADPTGQSDSGFLSDVPELSAAQVLPQFTSATATALP